MTFFNLKDSRLNKWKSNQNKALKKASKLDSRVLKTDFSPNIAKWVRKNKKYNIDLPNKSLPLHVVRSSGINVTPNIKINVTDLNKEKGILYKNFYNNSDNSITFKIDILIHKDEAWNSELYGLYKGLNASRFRVSTVLKEWARNMVPLNIVTNALDVPNGTYVITKNSTRKQTFENTSIWTLEFTTFNPLNLYVYKNNNPALTKAKKKNKIVIKPKVNVLLFCKLTNFKYTKTKKTNSCVKRMQSVLYRKGFLKKKQVDGWFGPVTKNAVKRFQKKYAKKYKLKATGVVDSRTINALVKV